MRDVAGSGGVQPHAEIHRSRWIRSRAEQKVHRARRFAGRLSVGSSDVDPLDRLGLPPEVEGLEMTADVTFPEGSRTWGLWPVGLVPPTWMIRAFPFRTW